MQFIALPYKTALFWKKHYAKHQKSILCFRPCQRELLSMYIYYTYIIHVKIGLNTYIRLHKHQEEDL